MIISLAMVFIWPAIASIISYFGVLTQGLGIVGAFIYGLILRGFYIIGLHHVFYLPFWTTAAGGTLEVGGKIVEGWQSIFLAQLADPNTTHYFSNIALYNSGRYFHMLFTMPAICLAMYTAIPKGPKRKAAFGFLFSIGLTSFLTGVTEPISFALLFASPLLFIAEAISFAISFVIAALAKVTIGSTFSAGLVEFLLFGVFQGNSKTNYIWIIILGVPIFIVNYFFFKFLIEKLNAKTPGREDDEEQEKSLKTKYTSGQAKDIIVALGGMENITDLDNCATRLRVTVKKLDVINQELLKQTGAHNVVVRGKNLQVIYGPTVNLIRTGSTFSAGLVEFLLFGVFQGNSKTNYIWIIILGVPIFIVNYFFFKFLIEKLNAKTPGREDDEEQEKSLKTKYTSGQAKDIIVALGGMENITDLDNCATRLRVTVKKLDVINQELLKQTGAHNVVVRGKNLQVIYGPTVNLIRTEIDEYISTL